MELLLLPLDICRQCCVLYTSYPFTRNSYKKTYNQSYYFAFSPNTGHSQLIYLSHSLSPQKRDSKRIFNINTTVKCQVHQSLKCSYRNIFHWLEDIQLHLLHLQNFSLGIIFAICFPFFKSSHWKAVHLTVKNRGSEGETQIWVGVLGKS